MGKEDWVSLKEIEKQTNISVPTLSRYADEYGHYILQHRAGNKRLIHVTSIEVMQKIRKYYDIKLTKDQIHEKLKAYPIIAEVKEENDMTKEVSEVKKFFEVELEKINQKFEQQQAYFDERMKERDVKLMEVMRSLHEEKKVALETATAHQVKAERKIVKEKKWWKLW
ncbi:hypothetical protein [Priestia megaterium]|uniref:hypothetical protein n=1 Tax=Priestia megaterium TaxID=1404 RepID=UPI001A94297C|nr:hypothetical protein [Priestia megaterium]QSX24479.1 hypothetical protein J0P05_32975 [Priestia megaterium]